MSVNNAGAAAIISGATASALGALGIEAQPLEFFMGSFLGAFAAIVFCLNDPKGTKAGIKLIMATSFVISTFAAIVHTSLFPGVKLPIVMGGAGALSPWMVRFLVGMAGGLEKRADKAAENVAKRYLGGDDDNS